MHGAQSFALYKVYNNTKFLMTGFAFIDKGCDPDRLYDGQATSSSLAEGATCDPPSNSIGTSDGYACYSGTLVGAYAVHRCLNCDYRSVRTCMADGNWNGTALQCNCECKKISTCSSNNNIVAMQTLFYVTHAVTGSL